MLLVSFMSPSKVSRPPTTPLFSKIEAALEAKGIIALVESVAVETILEAPVAKFGSVAVETILEAPVAKERRHRHRFDHEVKSFTWASSTPCTLKEFAHQKSMRVGSGGFELTWHALKAGAMQSWLTASALPSLTLLEAQAGALQERPGKANVKDDAARQQNRRESNAAAAAAAAAATSTATSSTDRCTRAAPTHVLRLVKEQNRFIFVGRLRLHQSIRRTALGIEGHPGSAGGWHSDASERYVCEAPLLNVSETYTTCRATPTEQII
eukprot:692917-Amphidinium_carterae.2